MTPSLDPSQENLFSSLSQGGDYISPDTRVHQHPSSPSPGHVWNAQTMITFDKVKLTNNRTPSWDENQVVMKQKANKIKSMIIKGILLKIKILNI